jgi:WD40 repeat protein
MRLYPKLNFTIIGIVPALLLFACTLALAQSVPVTTTPTREFEGHTRGVISIAFSLDGRRIASGSRDKTIKLWETETGNPVRTFQGHNEEVTSVAFSPDARWIASAARDKTIKIWDTSTDTVRGNRFIGAPRGHLLARRTFHRDGKPDGALNVWDVATLSPVRTFQADGGCFP